MATNCAPSSAHPIPAFDRQSRLALAMIYARFCKLLADQGQTVVIATISLFHEVHAWNRAHMPAYLEVFLDAPEAARRARDRGYAAADQGQSGADGRSGHGCRSARNTTFNLEYSSGCARPMSGQTFAGNQERMSLHKTQSSGKMDTSSSAVMACLCAVVI